VEIFDDHAIWALMYLGKATDVRGAGNRWCATYTELPTKTVPLRRSSNAKPRCWDLADGVGPIRTLIRRSGPVGPGPIRGASIAVAINGVVPKNSIRKDSRCEGARFAARIDAAERSFQSDVSPPPVHPLTIPRNVGRKSLGIKGLLTGAPPISSGFFGFFALFGEDGTQIARCKLGRPWLTCNE
jgi:hypothetical protein